MVFSSLFFTFIFLPFIMIIYYLAEKKYRNYILLTASIYFYSYGEPLFVYVMSGSIMINWGLALWIVNAKENGKRTVARNILILAAILNAGLLFLYKYLYFCISVLNNIFGTNLNVTKTALPIGISFFTFQALSYVIDIYRGTVKVQKNPLYLALYISFFPQLIAGPIVRYSSIEKQIIDRVHSTDKFAEGARRFMLGFAKKVILANNLSVVVTDVFSMDIISANPVILWLGSVCFTLHIYYDFSGYSDMAIGLGKIFGFDFEENFNYPYISKSITEFWRRWHISLGEWFRDYVYIPLGGSRVPVSRHLINMFIVWTLTGIWHGANYTFVCWGLGYFILLVIEKYIIKPEKRKNIFIRTVWQLVTLFCINFGWVIFNSASVKDGIRYCSAMLGKYGIIPVIDDKLIRYFREYGFFIIMGILFATPIVKIIEKKMNDIKWSRGGGIVTSFLWMYISVCCFIYHFRRT